MSLNYKHTIVLITFAILVLLAISAQASASLINTIQGHVYDANGQKVEGARVSLMNGTLELAYNISTSGPDSGAYSITVVNINRGLYTMVIEKGSERNETPINIINLGHTAFKDLYIGNVAATPMAASTTPAPSATAAAPTTKTPFTGVIVTFAAISLGAMASLRRRP